MGYPAFRIRLSCGKSFQISAPMTGNDVNGFFWSLLLWEVTQLTLVVYYRHFSSVSVPSSRVKQYNALPICYHSSGWGFVNNEYAFRL